MSYGGYMENIAQTQPNFQECTNQDTSKKKSFKTFIQTNINEDRLTINVDELQSQILEEYEKDYY